MRIGAIGFEDYNSYIGGTARSGANPEKAVSLTGAPITGVTEGEEVKKPVINPGESEVKAPGRTSAPSECETCKNRKYQDGSDEMVSFKSAAHISPNAAAAAVRGHEQEHVSNAYKKAEQNDGKVLQASVALKTAVCPECGRSYVAGGTTTTKIKYGNDDDKNQYAKDRKAIITDAILGQNVDEKV